MVGLVGPSGCGKSTLLELICGLREPPRRDDRGRRRAAPRPGASSRCAYMPQRDLLLPWYSAIDNAALALRNRGMRRRPRRAGGPASCSSRFGLAGFERARPEELSGGMRQRVAFLRTLSPASRCWRSTSRSPRSTRSPGPRCRSGWRGRWQAQPRTVVLVTHDVEEALYLSDRVAVLSARPARVVAEFGARAARRPTATTRSPSPGSSPSARKRCERCAKLRPWSQGAGA